MKRTLPIVPRACLRGRRLPGRVRSEQRRPYRRHRRHREQPVDAQDAGQHPGPAKALRSRADVAAQAVANAAPVWFRRGDLSLV